MIREEAIEIIKAMQTDNFNYEPEEIVEALDMAIEALKNQPRFIIHSDGTIEQIIEICEDCISRKAVLDCLTASGLKKFDFLLDVRDKIKNLPSITPKPKEIYNKGWKDGAEATAYHVELCEEENPTIPLSVIEDIKAEIEEESRFCPLTEGLECALEIINKHIAERGSK